KYEEAQKNFRESLQAARSNNFKNLEADSLRWLGVLAYDTGHLGTAYELYEHSLALYEQLENKQGQSAVHNNLSVVAFSQGNIEQSLVSLEKAQKIDSAIGDREGNARVLTNLSSLNLDLGA